jgi:hypothetical protein
MNPLSAATLLDVWERGRSQSLVGRGLLLLGAASPELSPEVLATLPLGRRDARLFTLRRWTFGSGVEGVVDCPECGERLELAFHLDDLGVTDSFGAGEGGDGVLEVEVAGERVRFRLPHSLDLEVVAALADPSRARATLLERCVVHADGGEPGEVRFPLTPGVATAVAAAMEAADPHASILLSSSCPSCGHGWDTPFDILPWFWDEIEAWGRRLLREVHVLARAYGWSEREILGMSTWRRRHYLELVAG